ncbi:hypothetical protein KBG31_00160 [Patescibacteria group bacterium]|nr:hypothetical protein [Patescibacteria group bacterium]HOM78250.1 hypothetical protein [bacterium]
MLSKTIKNRLYLAYLCVLAITIIFCGYAQSIDSMDVVERADVKKSTEKTRNVDVNIEIYSSASSKSPQFSDRVKMSNKDSVSDLLRSLRSDNVITYEVTLYTDRTEINHVNNIYPQVGEEWRVFVDGKDITSQLSSVNLENNKTYVLKLIHI